MKKPSAVPKALREQVIRADEVYSLDEFKLRTRLGQAAMRSARKAGLSVIYCGGRGFVTGQSWLDHLSKLQRQQNGNGSTPGNP